LMNSGELFREVAVHGYIFKRAHPISTPVRNLFRMCEKSLYDSGFVLSGYTLEGMGCEWETIAMNYQKGSMSMRLLFNNLFPPVMVMRRENADAVIDPFCEKEPATHPFTELFTPKDARYDVRTMRDTQYEVRLPTEFDIPLKLRDDYAKTIAAFFPDGVEGFRQQVRRRGLRNPQRVLKIVQV
jgi:hypothetical protein